MSPRLRPLLLATSLALVAVLSSSRAGAALPAPGAFPHAHFSAVLARFVDAQGLVDYATLARDRAELDAYTAILAATSPKRDPELFPTRQDQLAYWLNAYNAWAMTAVIDRPGLQSVHDQLLDFFYTTRHRLGGRKVSLYKLENGIVRKEFGDPRVHFALNCQSIGCPRLPRKAFEPASLDAELDAASAEFCANPAKVRPAAEEKKLWASQIFEWYAEDFASSGGVIGFCAQHGQAFDPSWSVAYIPYDWALMSQPGRGP